MPTFSVKAPDGRTFHVNAPKGTTQAQAIAYVQKNHPAPAPRSTLQTAGDFLGDVVDNVTPNWGDEAYGAANWIGNKVGLNDSKAPFHEGQAYFKRTQAQYDKEHPKLAWGSTIGGTVAGLAAGGLGELGTAAKVVAKASKLKRAVQAAKVGGIYGMISGAGDGDSLGDRATNALQSGAIGAATGAIIPSVGDAAVKAGRFVRSAIPGVDPALQAAGNLVRRGRGLPPAPPHARAHAQADRMIAQTMPEDHIIHGPGVHGPDATPQAVADEVARRSRMNVPAMPADTTEGLRDLTSWASRGQGPGQTAVRQALAARKAGEGARVRQHVTETLGPAVDPIAAVQENLAASKAAAHPLYEQGYQQPTQITPDMAKIMQTPAFKDAVPQAAENIKNNFGNPMVHGFVPMPDGSFQLPAGGVPSTEAFDQIVRAMQESARGRADINPITGAVTHNTNSVHINSRAKDLRSELSAQNPFLKQAVEGYADEAAHRQALQAGTDVGKLNAHEIADLSRQLPQDAHPSFMQGARSSLADQASEYGAKFPNGDTSVAVRKTIGDPAKVEQLTNMDTSQRVGPSALPALQNRLEAEHQGNIVAKDVLQGSKTGNKAALDGQLDEEAAPKLTSFSAPGIAKAAWNFIAEKASTPYRNEVKKRIAQVVTETNPQNVQDLMHEIAGRAQKDKHFANLMQRSGVIEANLYGRAIKTAPASDQPEE